MFKPICNLLITGIRWRKKERKKKATTEKMTECKNKKRYFLPRKWCADDRPPVNLNFSALGISRHSEKLYSEKYSHCSGKKNSGRMVNLRGAWRFLKSRCVAMRKKSPERTERREWVRGTKRKRDRESEKEKEEMESQAEAASLHYELITNSEALPLIYVPSTPKGTCSLQQS